MALRACSVCYSYRTRMLKDGVFCEDCGVFDTGNHTSVLSLRCDASTVLDLCGNCKKKMERRGSGKVRTVRCRTVNDYVKSMDYCKGCQVRNTELLKNQYYKNFLLYRRNIPYFSRCFILFYILIILYFDSYFLDIMSSFYIWIWTKPTHKVYFVLSVFLLYFIRKCTAVRIVLCLVDVIRMWRMKWAVFDVPVNPYEDAGLKDLVKNLSLKTKL